MDLNAALGVQQSISSQPSSEEEPDTNQLHITPLTKGQNIIVRHKLRMNDQVFH